MALNREERKLLHHKSRKPTFGVNKPDPNEGKNGDISFRKIQGSGTVQYIKDNGNWLAIGSSGNLPPQRQIIYSSSSSSSGTSSSVTNHGDLLGLGDDNHTQYVHNTIARTITADHNFTGTPVFASPDINGGTIDAITSLTVANNVDIGSHDLRAATFTADGLTETRVVFAGANGVLSDDSDLTFSSDTLTATKIGAFTAAGAINFDNQDMTNVDIDSGAIDGTTIGANSQAAGDFTAIGAVAAGTIVGTTIDATTDFTIDGLIITADTITNDADLTIDGAGDIALSADGGNITMDDGTDTIFDFDVDNTKLTIHDDQDTGDKVEMIVSQHGAFTIASTDDDATAADITLDADGDVILDPHSDEVKIFKQGSDYGAKLIARDSPAFIIHSGNGSSEGDLILRTEGNTIDMKSYVASGPTETTRISFKLDSTPELDATGDFKIDGSGDITLDSVDDFYVITNTNEIIKANTSGNIFFHAYPDNLNYNNYKLNVFGDTYHFTTGQADFKQNYTILSFFDETVTHETYPS
tara:strand:- start:1 stop:1581 length:1581 start_codon:yes stop_codon:yes gene_type:complete